MPVELRFLHGGLGALYNGSGVLKGAEFINANHMLLMASDGQIKQLRYAIIDMTAAGRLEISTTEVENIAEQDRAIAARAQDGLIVAVVSPHDLGYGLSRMWQALAEHTGWTMMTFRQRADADRWIRDTVKSIFGTDLPDKQGQVE